MNQKNLSIWLKVTVVGLGVVVSVCFALITSYKRELSQQSPGFESLYNAWMIFIGMTYFPDLKVLHYFWKIASNIGKNRSFCKQNASIMKMISIIAAICSIYLFAGSIVFWIIGLNEPIILLISIVIVLLGTAFSVAAAVLSHLILKAAEMKEENDLTI